MCVVPVICVSVTNRPCGIIYCRQTDILLLACCGEIFFSSFDLPVFGKSSSECLSCRDYNDQVGGGYNSFTAFHHLLCACYDNHVVPGLLRIHERKEHITHIMHGFKCFTAKCSAVLLLQATVSLLHHDYRAAL